MARVRKIKEPETEREEEKPDSSELQHEREQRIIARYKEKATTPQKAIRAHCVECMGGAVGMVADCTSSDCALHPFRMGKNPFRKKRSDTGVPKRRRTRLRLAS